MPQEFGRGVSHYVLRGSETSPWQRSLDLKLDLRVMELGKVSLRVEGRAPWWTKDGPGDSLTEGSIYWKSENMG